MKLTKAQAALLRAMQIGHECRRWEGRLGKTPTSYDARVDGRWRGVTPQARKLIALGLAEPSKAGTYLTLTQAGKEWSDADQSG